MIFGMGIHMGLIWDAPVTPLWDISNIHKAIMLNLTLRTPNMFDDLLLSTLLFVPVQAYAFYLTLTHLGSLSQ